MEMKLTGKLFFILYCLLEVTNTHARSVAQNNDDGDDGQSDKAKEIKSNISTLKLNKIPHRIYVAGNDIIEDFEKSLLMKNHVEMKFTYELVEPKLCEVFNPPFGCCWDNKTVALGPHNEGCPACKNKKKSCRKWKDQCHTQVIKDNCPETCNICPKVKDTSCQDSPDQKAFCPYYARFGLCKKKQIRDFCKGSCRVCENDLDETQKIE